MYVGQIFHKLLTYLYLSTKLLMFSHIHLVLEEHITLIMPLHLSVVAEVTNYIKIGSLHSVLTLLTHFAKCDVCFLCLYQHIFSFFLNSEHNALSSMCFQMSMEENNSSFLHHAYATSGNYSLLLFTLLVFFVRRNVIPATTFLLKCVCKSKMFCFFLVIGGEVTFKVRSDSPTLTGAKATFNIDVGFPQNQTTLSDGQVVWARNCTINGK